MKISTVKEIIRESIEEKERMGFPIEHKDIITDRGHINLLRSYGLPSNMIRGDGGVSAIDVLEWFENEKGMDIDITSQFIEVKNIQFVAGPYAICNESFVYRFVQFPACDLSFVCLITCKKILERIEKLSY